MSSPRLLPFVCTACDAHLRLPEQYVGKAILCPKCAAPQRFVNAETPIQPMDTTRALRADELPETPELGPLTQLAPTHPYPTPPQLDRPITEIAPIAQVLSEHEFDPQPAPPPRRTVDPALTSPARRASQGGGVDEPGAMPLAYPVQDAPGAVMVAPRSHSLVVVLVCLGFFCVGLAVSLIFVTQALADEKVRRREAEARAQEARISAEEAARQVTAIEARQEELLRQLRRP